MRQTELFVILGHFLPFYHVTTQKIKILKKWRKHLEMSSFYMCVPKITIKWCMLLKIWSEKNIFKKLGPFFALLPLYWPQKLKFGKKCKENLKYCPFAHMHQKWRSYDIWFLGYKVIHTEFFVILCHFLPFDPPSNLKIKMLKNWKKSLEILSFYTCVPQMMIIWCMVPEIWSAKDRIFFHFGTFFVILPPSPLPLA